MLTITSLKTFYDLKMSITLLTEQINNTADKWIELSELYSIDVLLTKPDLQSWSLGQVAMHVVTETDFYLQQVEDCLRSNENIHGEMTADAKMMFDQNRFPDIRIKRDSSLSQFYPQPTSKAEMRESMQQLKVQLNNLLKRIETSSYGGKTRHPGLGYFNALQWIQFAEMHMRHHLAQKDRIEAALKLG
jgi:DinB family protein